MTGNNKKGMRKNFEATVLQLKRQIEARSTEFEETNKNVKFEKDMLVSHIATELEESNKNAKLEKDMLLSQIAATEKKTADISRSSQMAQEAFNAEKENLLSRLAELQTTLELTVSEKGSLSETNRELSTETKSLKAHVNEYSKKLASMEAEKQALEAVCKKSRDVGGFT